MRYKARVLKKGSDFHAEFMEGIVIEKQTVFSDKFNAIHFLNKHIKGFNAEKGLNMPLVTVKNLTVEYHDNQPEPEPPQITRSPPQAVENVEKSAKSTVKRGNEENKQGSTKEANPLKNNETESAKQDLSPAKQCEAENKLRTPTEKPTPKKPART